MTITIADGRGALWQWDTGRRLRVGSGVEQVHYKNRCFGRSVDVNVGTDGTAIIPDELLQDCHTLTAYAYVTDDTGAYTMVQQDFAVHKRAKPAGYTYTPTDQMTLRTIQHQIGDLADLTTEAKENLVAAINEVARMGGRMSLRVADDYIQYSADGGSTWANLIAMAELKGADGAPGKDGHSPVVTSTKSGKTTTINVDGAAIAAESGKTITSVVVKMGGVDITATAYSAGSGAINIAKVTGAVTITAAASVPSVLYSVTRNLTNCASSNTANNIAKLAAYTTTLSPTGTYKKLGAITVTMGGTDISASAVSGNTVTIAKVTGNIVITCAAVITNIIDTVGISADTRLSAGSGANKPQTGWATIGANMDAPSLIHLHYGDILRIKGASLPASNDGKSIAVSYSETATFKVAGYIYNGYSWNTLKFTTVGDIVTITGPSEHYLRLSLICTDASAVIATINEPIT